MSDYYAEGQSDCCAHCTDAKKLIYMASTFTLIYMLCMGCLRKYWFPRTKDNQGMIAR